MKADKLRHLSTASGESPLSASTRGQLDSLTGSQLKALLMVAADPGVERLEGETERLLADLSGSSHAVGAALLTTAATETTPVQELVRIKEVAKAWAKDADDGPHRDAARLLYHLAVAGAFVHHGAAISGRPLRKQLALYERFGEAWTGHAIGRVFQEAVARLTEENPIDGM